MMTNAELLVRDHRHLIHPLHDPKAHKAGHVWVKGEGAILTDADGKKYLDGLSGLWNVVAGHGRAELAEAAKVQMEALGYCSGYSGSSNPQAIELAERLADLTYPSINRFFFTCGGSEASESSFKMARSYWKLRGKPDKTKVISRQWGYHGVTLAAMSATGISSYWPLFEPRVPGFIHIPSPYPYRYKAPAGVSQGVAAANELERAIEREGPETGAMFFAEPVQGAGG
ncbi:MAG: aminotransferase class III-fold pyridoxal phosphate-dependent enzyme, partial [Acidimicrobiia bacterium]